MSYQRALSELQSQARPCSCARCTSTPEYAIDPSTVRDVVESAWDVYDNWEQLPETTKETFRSTARALWPDLKALQFRRLIATAWSLFAPARFRKLSAGARAGYISGLVRQA